MPRRKDGKAVFGPQDGIFKAFQDPVLVQSLTQSPEKSTSSLQSRTVHAAQKTSRIRVKLPAPVAAIYRAVAELEAMYPRKFTPDGHLVGSIGEVVAAEALGLTLYPMSRHGHDAYDDRGDVQIKMTSRNRISMYSEPCRLVVLRITSDEEAEIVYDGSGREAWSAAGPVAKNGQRSISLSKLRSIHKAEFT